MVDWDNLENWQKAVHERGTTEALERLRDDIFARYSPEELIKIISGEGWIDTEAMAISVLGGFIDRLESRDGVGQVVIMALTLGIKAVTMVAFLSGYEKAKSEALVEDLGLEENDD